MIEICCGSLEDALAAHAGGAKQIELNSALALGGLTPSLGTLQLVKHYTDLTTICMIRPRGGGFTYSTTDFKVMLHDCQLLLENGADGIAFGFLNSDKSINTYQTQSFVKLIHHYNKIAVFHRAIDICTNYHSAIEHLISLNVDRILTSGQHNTALEATKTLFHAHQLYGNQIEFLLGSGINTANVVKLITATGISNVHSSCKVWTIDPSTSHHNVDFSLPSSHIKNAYDCVSTQKVKDLILAVKTMYP